MYPKRLGFLALAIAALSIGPSIAATTTLSPAAMVPASAPTAAASNFVAWAFEAEAFYNYSGGSGNPNTFTQNMLRNVGEKTNNPFPVVRVGGTSLDDSDYNPDLPPGQPYVEHGTITFGPSYFAAYNNTQAAFVFDGPFYGVPLKNNNLTNVKQFAKAGQGAMGSKLYLIEVGNEPNTYGSNTTVDTYIAKWVNYTTAINQALGFTSTSSVYDAINIFLPNNKPNFTAMDIWNGGLKNYRERINSVSLHFYQLQDHSDYPIQRDLMNHSATVHNMRAVKANVDFFTSVNVPLCLAEVGSTFCKANNTECRQLGDIMGTALWQSDFHLYSMSIGVQRTNMQQSVNGAYDEFRSFSVNGSAPEVRPAYYAQLFAAAWIGTSGTMRTVEIPLQTDLVSAYAGYVGGQLTQIAIINLNVWLGNGTHPVSSFAVQVPDSYTIARVNPLTGPHGAYASNTTNIVFGGMSYDYAHQTGFTNLALQQPFNRTITDGQFTVNVPDTEAFLIHLI